MRQASILLIEDEEAIRDMVSVTLADYGYSVVGVGTESGAPGVSY